MSVAAAIVDRILDLEGGASNQASDYGGLTNFGMTLPWLSDRLGRDATPQELLSLTREQAKTHYLNWLDQTKLSSLCHHAADFPMAACVIDWAVQTNPVKAVKLLQTALGFAGADIDGTIGPQTLAAYDAVPEPSKVVLAMVKARVYQRVRVVKNDVSQLTFLAGWISRDMSFL